MQTAVLSFPLPFPSYDTNKRTSFHHGLIQVSLYMQMIKPNETCAQAHFLGK